MPWTKKFKQDVEHRRQFEDTHCMLCKNEDAGDCDFCPIHTRMMSFMRGDPDFPKQIMFTNNKYQCLMFNRKLS